MFKKASAKEHSRKKKSYPKKTIKQHIKKQLSTQEKNPNKRTTKKQKKGEFNKSLVKFAREEDIEHFSD